MFFLLRLLGALIPAVLVGFVILLIGALSSSSSEPAPIYACSLSVVALAATLGVFVWAFRRLGRGKLEQLRVASEVESRKTRALLRNVAPKATLVATMLGHGSHTTATLRAAWQESDNLISVDAVEGGAWRNVFTARFHDEAVGQVVPTGMHPTVGKDRYSISTRRLGHEAIWWEVLAYIPGDWEEELERLWEAAKEARTERDKDRFGL